MTLQPALTFTVVPCPVSPSLSLFLSRTYSAAFIAANGGTLQLVENAFITGLEAGLAYVNIHITIFPGGEIRGQLLAVPEPASLVLLGSALLGLCVLRRRNKQT